MAWPKGRPFIHTAEAKEKIRQANLGHRHSTETRKKISDSLKGEKNPFYGTHLTAEAKAKLSEMRKGEKNPFYGKQHTPETRKKFGHPGEKNSSWNGGISFELYSAEFNKTLKEEIRERDNRTCQICFEQKKRLPVHHIDYMTRRITNQVI